jgi:hypothetical protein
MIRAFFFLVCVLFSASARAGQRAGSTPERPTVTATRLNAGESLMVDGNLDEAVWRRAVPAADFKQFDPKNGAPATEATEIRIVIDHDNLYIGAQFFDSDPTGLRGNQMVRDGSLGADDRFIWVLDPFYDQRSGYYFEVNPSGAMGDAQLIQASGTTGGTIQNRAWDGIWRARVRRTDKGWTAEIAIPFRTLSFNPDQQAWGANFQRTVRRKNEESLWAGWDRNQGIYSLGAAGRIEGITDVSQGRGLDIKPYVIGNYRDTTSAAASTYKGNTGLDFLYSVTPQLKANLTINTDFAQTEVDDRQVNLTRFPLFFPEKRDFFLEGQGNFDFSREASNDLTAFFTRRIGITDKGQPQKIDYGAKLGGQVGRFNVGMMQVRTAEQPDAAGEDFLVLRPKRQFLRESYVGAIYTRRSTRNSTVQDRHSIGADFQLSTARFRGNQNLIFTGFFIKTPDGVKRTDNESWGLRLNYPNDKWRLQVATRQFAKNFAPAIGFSERVDFKKYYTLARFAPRPKNNRWIRQVGFQAFPEVFYDWQNKLVERNVQLQLLDLDFHSGDSIGIRVTPSYDHLQADFRIGGGITLPVGTEYNFTRYNYSFSTANQRKISGNANYTVGGFYSGTRRDISGSVNLRPRRGILATLTTTFNKVDLPQGHFSSKVMRAVINTQLNPFISISNNIQFDSVSRVLGWQYRFRWIVQPGNDIYVVWLNNWQDTGPQLTTLDRSAAVKAVYTYGF